MAIFHRIKRIVIPAGLLAGLLAFPAPCVENTNGLRLEAVGTDQVGAATSRTWSGITGTVAVSSEASATSLAGNGSRVVIGPAKLGVVADEPPPTEDDLLQILLGKSNPGPAADRNGDGVVDIGDIVTLLQ